MKLIALDAGSVELAGAPEVIAILPLGHVKSSKGDFYVDAESLEAMKQEIAQRGVDVVIDYEHQTLKGVQAPAAGWVKELFLKDGAIMGRVEWTPAAVKYLENKEYRYLSPVITVRKSDGKAMGLHSGALTNTPAIEGMTPIVNKLNLNDSEGGQNTMDLVKQIAQMLGLPDTATEEEVIAAVKALAADVQSLKDASAKGVGGNEAIVANKAVCELVGLKAGAPTNDVVTKIVELKSGKIDGVNIVEELKALKKQAAERDAEDAVQMALKAGKIAPALKDWAKGYALSDSMGFAAFVEKAPQTVPMGEIELGDTKALKDTPDEATLLACKQLGVSLEDLKKYGYGKE